MEWSLDFISEQDFINHVAATIEKYGEKLESFDIKRFNKNIIGYSYINRNKHVSFCIYYQNIFYNVFSNSTSSVKVL